MEETGTGWSQAPEFPSFTCWARNHREKKNKTKHSSKGNVIPFNYSPRPTQQHWVQTKQAAVNMSKHLELGFPLYLSQFSKLFYNLLLPFTNLTHSFTEIKQVGTEIFLLILGQLQENSLSKKSKLFPALRSFQPTAHTYAASKTWAFFPHFCFLNLHLILCFATSIMRTDLFHPATRIFAT